MVSIVRESGKELPEIFTLHPFLENIIDKKVNRVALTIFEHIVDSLCSYFCASYNERLAYRLKEKELETVHIKVCANDDSSAKAIAQKVHYFADGAPLYDRTATQRASIVQPEFLNFITEEKSFGPDQIWVDGKAVHFSENPKEILIFGKKFNTEEVFVTDVKECPELVIIYERESTNNLNAWFVDTTQPTELAVTGGQLIIAKSEIFVAKPLKANPQTVILQNFI